MLEIKFYIEKGTPNQRCPVNVQETLELLRNAKFKVKLCFSILATSQVQEHIKGNINLDRNIA